LLIFEAFDKKETGVTNLLQGPRRFGRLDGKLTVIFLLIPGRHLAEVLVQVSVMSLEVDQKLADGLYENPDPPQMCHVGKDMDGIQPLF